MEHTHTHKLYRNEQDKMIAGVLAGFAEYFKVDAAFIRLGIIFLAIVTGIIPMALTYLIAAVIIPRKKTEVTYDEDGKRTY